MLIDLVSELAKHNIDSVASVVHVGAHNLEEAPIYDQLKAHEVLWMDPMLSEAALQNIADNHVFVQHAAWYESGCVLPFHVANNGQSSSLFEFGTHAKHHPDVKFVGRTEVKTMTVDEVVKTYSHFGFCDLLVMDIQGTELQALLGANRVLCNSKAVYLEVNDEEVYSGCAHSSTIDSVLGAYGYQRVAKHMTGAGWGDALYLKR